MNMKKMITKDYKNAVAAVPSDIYGKRFEKFVNEKVFTGRKGIRFTSKEDFIR